MTINATSFSFGSWYLIQGLGRKCAFERETRQGIRNFDFLNKFFTKSKTIDATSFSSGIFNSFKALEGNVRLNVWNSRDSCVIFVRAQIESETRGWTRVEGRWGGRAGNNHGRGKQRARRFFRVLYCRRLVFYPRRVYESTCIREGQTSKVHRALPPFFWAPSFFLLPWPPFTFSAQSAHSLPVAGKVIQNRVAICPNILATIFNWMKRSPVL